MSGANGDGNDDAPSIGESDLAIYRASKKEDEDTGQGWLCGAIVIALKEDDGRGYRRLIHLAAVGREGQLASRIKVKHK